jgi:hypothetical protein
MSSKAYIQQVTTIIHKTKETAKSVSVFDDYGQGSICLDDYRNTFFEDDMELLLFVLEKAKTVGLDDVNDVLDSVYGNKKGMNIEGTWYGWEQIEPVFEKAL